jgi:hypothetical protein
MGLPSSGYMLGAGCCEHGSEPLGFHKMQGIPFSSVVDFISADSEAHHVHCHFHFALQICAQRS